MADVFFLTGATGFLGTMLAAELIRIPEACTYVLVRAADDEEAYHRLRGLWYHDRDLYESIGKKIFPVAGDFTEEDLGISGETAKFLMETVTHVIHAGAEIGFQKSYEELYKTNCVGTMNMPEAAQ